jgi:hypothetical protein
MHAPNAGPDTTQKKGKEKTVTQQRTDTKNNLKPPERCPWSGELIVDNRELSPPPDTDTKNKLKPPERCPWSGELIVDNRELSPPPDTDVYELDERDFKRVQSNHFNHPSSKKILDNRTEIDETVVAVDWNQLPPEVWLHIFGFLSSSQVVRASLVCWRWHTIAADDKLWKDLCDAEFDGQHELVYTLSGIAATSDPSYKKLYREMLHTPFFQWDPEQPVEVWNHGLTASQQNDGWTTNTTKQPLKNGIVNYFEVTFEKFGGSSFLVGIGAKRQKYSNWPMNCPRTWGWHCGGTIYFNNGESWPKETSISTYRSYGKGAVVGVYVDLKEGLIAWFLDGKQVSRPLYDAQLVSPKNKDVASRLYPLVSWGGTSYVLTLSVNPRCPTLNKSFAGVNSKKLF